MQKKRSYGKALVLLLMIGVLVINYLALSAPLTNNNGISIFNQFGDKPSKYTGKLALALVVMFYISVLTVIIPIISMITKKTKLIYIGLGYLIIFQIFLLVYPFIYQMVTPLVLVLTVINLFIVVISIVLLGKVKPKEIEVLTQKEAASHKKVASLILIVNVVAIILTTTTFFVPLYSITSGGITKSVILINVLSNAKSSLADSVLFLVFLGLFLTSILYFAASISCYVSNKKEYIKRSLTIIKITSLTTLIFFVTGLIVSMLTISNQQTSSTISFIPMIGSIIIILVYSILSGSVIATETKKASTFKESKAEPIIYIVLLTGTIILLLFINIVKINIKSLNHNEQLNLTGLKILTDYASLGAGYNVLAFLLIVALISSGIVLVLAIASYLSKFKQYGAIIKTAVLTNFFFVFILGISGFYFSIAKEINEELILSILDSYGIKLPSIIEYTYKIETDAIISLMAAVVIIVVMIVRKSLNPVFADDVINVKLTDESVTNDNTVSETTNEEVTGDFDPCPQFTFLDNAAKPVLPEAVSNTSLNELVNFVVEYAKNSRLHLSYTTKDIATFISGLAATRLSILQGMSGTGKTSLPKIFSEAIFGNCEIIEVESSWKDKNELLGYYNEFSMKYTPKKFTLALYKAALNPEQFTFIVLDEMNLSRIEYYFSDFLSLMENEESKREIRLLNINISRTKDDNQIEYLALKDGNTLKVPPNVWFLGTANRDESTFVISDKVYDRAHTINFTKRAPKVREYGEVLAPRFYNYQTVNQLLNDAKLNGDFDCENSDLIKKIESLVAPFNISFGNRILKQIEEFVNVYQACFPGVDCRAEAIETILLSKVVAKLEIKTIDNKDKLVKDFQDLNLMRCAEFIRTIDGE